MMNLALNIQEIYKYDSIRSYDLIDWNIELEGGHHYKIDIEMQGSGIKGGDQYVNGSFDFFLNGTLIKSYNCEKFDEGSSQGSASASCHYVYNYEALGDTQVLIVGNLYEGDFIYILICQDIPWYGETTNFFLIGLTVMALGLIFLMIADFFKNQDRKSSMLNVY